MRWLRVAFLNCALVALCWVGCAPDEVCLHLWYLVAMRSPKPRGLSAPKPSPFLPKTSRTFSYCHPSRYFLILSFFVVIVFCVVGGHA